MKYFIVFCAVLVAFSASAQVPGVPADSSAQVPGVSVDSSAQVQGVPADSPAEESGTSVDFGVHGNIISSDINAVLRQIAGLPAPSGTYEIALEEVYGLGLGGGLHLDVDFGLLTVRLSGDYVTLSPDEEKFASAVQVYFPGAELTFVEGGQIEMISGALNAKLVVLPIPAVRPYITGGGGLTYLKTTKVKLLFNGVPIPDFEILKAQTVPTLNAGAGVDLELGPVTLYGEIKINWLFIEEGNSTFIPIGTVGVTF